MNQSAASRSRSRTAARVAAVQALFQAEQSGDSAEIVISQFVHYRLGAVAGDDGFENGRAPNAEAGLFGLIVRAASDRQNQLDPMIAEALPDEWPIDRLDPVLRAVMRAGAAELSMPDGPPGRVVINEYLDVAHGFFQGDEPRMVNGLLDRLARSLRPQDFEVSAV
jgi:N utilization substance protein B